MVRALADLVIVFPEAHCGSEKRTDTIFCCRILELFIAATIAAFRMVLDQYHIYLPVDPRKILSFAASVGP